MNLSLSPSPSRSEELEMVIGRLPVRDNREGRIAALLSGPGGISKNLFLSQLFAETEKRLEAFSWGDLRTLWVESRILSNSIFEFLLDFYKEQMEKQPEGLSYHDVVTAMLRVNEIIDDFYCDCLKEEHEKQPKLVFSRNRGFDRSESCTNPHSKLPISRPVEFRVLSLVWRDVEVNLNDDTGYRLAELVHRPSDAVEAIAPVPRYPETSGIDFLLFSNRANVSGNTALKRSEAATASLSSRGPLYVEQPTVTGSSSSRNPAKLDRTQTSNDVCACSIAFKAPTTIRCSPINASFAWLMSVSGINEQDIQELIGLGVRRRAETCNVATAKSRRFHTEREDSVRKSFRRPGVDPSSPPYVQSSHCLVPVVTCSPHVSAGLTRVEPDRMANELGDRWVRCDVF